MLTDIANLKLRKIKLACNTEDEDSKDSRRNNIYILTFVSSTKHQTQLMEITEAETTRPTVTMTTNVPASELQLQNVILGTWAL